MGNELCVASGGCPHKVGKKRNFLRIFSIILIKIPRWTFCWSTTPRSHLSWTLIKIAREIANARDGRWIIPRKRKGYKRDYFQIKSGKIVEGQEPPGELPPFSSATFSAAGREGTAVAPCGKVDLVH